MNKKVLTKLMAVLMFILFGVVGASAGTLRLWIQDYTGDVGGAFVEIIDNFDSNDMDTGAGRISYWGDVGDWEIDVSTALSKPGLDNDEFTVEMYLNSENYNNSDTGKLLILVTDTDFEPPAYSWDTHVWGETEGSIEVNAYFDDSNVEYGMGTQIANIGPLSSVFDNTDHWDAQSDPLYSMTIESYITHGAYQFTGFHVNVTGKTDVTPVPEPSLILLIGIGIAGVELIRRKSQ